MRTELYIESKKDFKLNLIIIDHKSHTIGIVAVYA